MEWCERDGIRWLEADLPGARAAFTTRLGGSSQAPFDSLNLGALTDDDPAAVIENRRRLAAALGLAPDRIAFAHQVHGADLLTHTNPPLRCSFAAHGDAKERGKMGVGQTTSLRCSLATDTEAKEQRSGCGAIPDADGHAVTELDTAALVFVADCVPVALAGPGGAAILHCGWRGLASSGRSSDRIAGISTTAGLIERGVVAVGATDAAIGPAIGPCCYEVGDEVLEAFADIDGAASGHMLDLPGIARELLRRAGVERVEVSGLCTGCEAELFFSHRRDAGLTGRQAGLVRLDGGEA